MSVFPEYTSVAPTYTCAAFVVVEMCATGGVLAPATLSPTSLDQCTLAGPPHAAVLDRQALGGGGTWPSTVSHCRAPAAAFCPARERPTLAAAAVHLAAGIASETDLVGKLVIQLHLRLLGQRTLGDGLERLFDVNRLLG